MDRRLFISLLAALPAIRVYADSTAYRQVREVRATRDSLTFHHRHDWSSPKIAPMFLDLTHHDKFLSAANDFAFVELIDRGQTLFRAPAPALTYLWISPDSRLFVGLSDIKLYNPYQLMVWKRDGSVMHREHITSQVAKVSDAQKREFSRLYPDAARFLADRYFTYGGATYVDYSMLGVPDAIGEVAWMFLSGLTVRHPYGADFKESVTNEIEWFDAARPELSIAQGGPVNLTLRSPSGNPIVIAL